MVISPSFFNPSKTSIPPNPSSLFHQPCINGFWVNSSLYPLDLTANTCCIEISIDSLWFLSVDDHHQQNNHPSTSSHNFSPIHHLLSITTATMASSLASSSSSPTDSNGNNVSPSVNNSTSPLALKILVQVFHPKTNAPNTPVDVAEVTKIITDTLAHHANRVPFITFAISTLTFHYSGRRSRPHHNQWASYFRLTFTPVNPNDQCDADIFRNQVISFALQNWHMHPCSHFSLSSPQAPYPDKLNPRVLTTPVSTSPWTEHVHWLFPACNTFDEAAHGILIGLFPQMVGSNRRVIQHILKIIYNKLLPFFASSTDHRAQKLADYDTFLNCVGLRNGLYPSPSNNAKNPSLKVFFFSTDTADTSNALINILCSESTPITFDYYGSSFTLTRFPTDTSNLKTQETDIVSTLRSIKNAQDSLVAVTTTRLIHLSSADNFDQLMSTPNLRALVPFFELHDSDFVGYKLCFFPHPSTVGLTPATLQQAPGIPHHLFRPVTPTNLVASPKTTPFNLPPNPYAAAAAHNPSQFTSSALSLLRQQWEQPSQRSVPATIHTLTNFITPPRHSKRSRTTKPDDARLSHEDELSQELSQQSISESEQELLLLQAYVTDHHPEHLAEFQRAVNNPHPSVSSIRAMVDSWDHCSNE
jgi:hypothetical protein